MVSDSDGTRSESELGTWLTTTGWLCGVLLLVTAALTPILLVLSPVLALPLLVFILARRERLGRGWLVLYSFGWIILIFDLWPFLGISV